VLSCELRQKEFKPEDDWIKIYHHSNPDYKYQPVDFAETDEGYVIVNGLTTHNISAPDPVLDVIRTNKAGELIENNTYQQWTYPVGEIFNNNGNNSIVCTVFPTQGYLVALDGYGSEELNNQGSPIESYVDSTNQLHIINFNVDASGEEQGSINIITHGKGGTRVNENVGNTHVINGTETRPRSVFPVFMGEFKMDGQNIIYANMFSQFTLKLTFFTANSIGRLGYRFGYQFDDGIKAFLPKGGNKFILVAFFDEDIYIDYDYTLESYTTDEQIKSDNFTEQYPMDLKKNTTIISKHVTFNGTDYGMFAATTASNEIGMLKCTLDSVPEIHEYRFPFDNEVELTTFKQDENGNILVLGKVKVDTHPRTMLMKIPKRKFE
jgi:hypothetical protein